MFSQDHVSGKILHTVGVIVPFHSEDDERWVTYAGRKLAEHFGEAHAVEGLGSWEIDGEAETSHVVVVLSFTPALTELDMTILIGIGWQVYQGMGRRRGVGVVMDDDMILF